MVNKVCFTFSRLEMKPSSMMSFSYVRDLFETRVRNELADPKTCFRINIAVDTV